MQVQLIYGFRVRPATHGSCTSVSGLFQGQGEREQELDRYIIPLERL